MSPWVQGLRSASVVAEQTSPGRLATHLPRGFGYRGAGAPWFKVSVGSWHEVPRTSLGLRSASVGAEQTSPGRLATHLPHGSGRGRAGAPWVQGLRSASVVAEQALYIE